MKSNRDYKNILVNRSGHLGDTLVTLPAFWEIRRRFPKAKLTLLTNIDGKNKNYITPQNILPDEGLFDNYLGYDNSAEGLGKIKVFAELFLKLKTGRFDCLYYLSSRTRTDAQIDRDLKFFRLAGIKNIFGAEYLKKNQLNFTESRPLPVVEPEYDFLLKSIDDGKQAFESEPDFDLKLREAELNFAEEWLKKNCGSDFANKKLVAIAPGSKWSSKLWFEQNYLKTLEKLIEEFDIFPIIFGGREDFETGQRLLSNLRNGANAAGSFSIRESAAALAKCRLYLGNDTGTMHLASAVKTPCVTIFAATDYQGRWYPHGKDNRIIRKTVECEGCHTPECFNEHLCLKLVSVDEVFEACKKIIGE